MAATTFTTWSALHTALLNALADFVANRLQVAEYEINTGSTTRRFKYRSVAELQQGISFTKSMMDEEAGTVSGRTYARNGGGRW